MILVDVLHQPGAIHRVVSTVHQSSVKASFALGISLSDSFGVLYFSTQSKKDAEECTQVMAQMGLLPIVIEVIGVQIVDGKETLEKVTRFLGEKHVNIEMGIIISDFGSDTMYAVLHVGPLQVKLSTLKRQLRDAGFQIA